MERTSPESESAVLKQIQDVCFAKFGGGDEREALNDIFHIVNFALHDRRAVAQCSREAVIEECAALCDGLRRRDYSDENEDWIAGTSDCATAIRALSDTSTDCEGK